MLQHIDFAISKRRIVRGEIAVNLVHAHAELFRADRQLVRALHAALFAQEELPVQCMDDLNPGTGSLEEATAGAVSSTPLTLPTICSVSLSRVALSLV